jgi:EAL domain-containing protein (putative c-di-GMP-specific phosphodiesterase class I)
MGTAYATHSLTAPTVNALADGLNKGEFVPFYHPLWDVQRQCWEGVETLVRWQHPTEGLIQPDIFIPVAEQSGLILELGAFVLQAACQQIMHWRQRGFPEGIIAVNVSALQIHQPDLVRILRKTGLPATALELELTKTLALEDTPILVENLYRCQALGTRHNKGVCDIRKM